MSEIDVEAIRRNYDRIADTYVARRDAFKSLPYLFRFASLMLPGGKVLDLGCGGGVPAAAYLRGHGFGVLGIDLSDQMVALARKNVPEATFEARNMLDLVDREFEVDGIVSFYAIFHTPRERHREILDRMATFLPSGGALLITMGATEWEGSEEDFFGAPMSWSHYGPQRNSEIVRAAGFEIVADEIDPSGGEQHQVILARRL